MNPHMMMSIGFCFLASGTAMLTGLTDRPLPDRLSMVAVEAMMWFAGFLFAASIRRTLHKN